MPLPTPTVTNIGKNGADISCAEPTGIPGPFTYQYERWQGDGEFTPGPVTVTPSDGSDGSFVPPSLVFPVSGTFAPPAQSVVYVPGSTGSKSLVFADDRGLTDPAPITFTVADYSVSGSYVSPTVSQILRWTGINTAILDDTDADLTSTISDLIALAEAETALEVTEARFSATGLSAHQVLVLQLSVAYHTAGDFLVSPAIRRLTGTHEPLLVEPGANLDDVSRLMHSRATELSTLYATGGDVSKLPTRAALNAMRGLR